MVKIFVILDEIFEVIIVIFILVLVKVFYRVLVNCVFFKVKFVFGNGVVKFCFCRCMCLVMDIEEKVWIGDG